LRSWRFNFFLVSEKVNSAARGKGQIPRHHPKTGIFAFAPHCELFPNRSLVVYYPVMTRTKFRGGLPLLVLLCALPLSCGTVPVPPDPLREETAFIPLEPGALVYLLADVKAARPVLDLVQFRELDDRQSKDLLDRTRSAAAALYPPGGGRRFQLTAWGTYPGFRADMAFGTNKNWKKQRSASGLSYWYSAANRLSVSLNPKQAFVTALSGEVPGDPFAAPPGVEAPEGFGDFRRGAIISCWLENAGAVVNRVLTAAKIPLQIPAERIFISLFPAPGQDGQYEALIRIQVSSASQAGALLTLFALARALIAGGVSPGTADGAVPSAAVLFANPPVQDGQNLTIKTAALTGEEIALLFNLFPVYFGQ
jgi:hypothetical protein